jgi:hypothetical protein
MAGETVKPPRWWLFPEVGRSEVLFSNDGFMANPVQLE